MRQIVLDTETTGIEPKEGHRIIEIGCVEVVNRKLTGNHFHVYINPGRQIEQEAIEVHGITNEFLQDKPVFADVAQDFVNFIRGAQLVIHNAPFDVGFMDHEFAMEPSTKGVVTRDICDVLDTLMLARKMHPGQKNNLDALCKRYGVDNSQRQLHGALLDAEILAEVYLLLTGGQADLGFVEEEDFVGNDLEKRFSQKNERANTVVIQANRDEMRLHEIKLDHIDSIAENGSIWRGTKKED